MNNRMIALNDEKIIDIILNRNFKEIEENLLTILENKEKFKHRAMIRIYDNNYKKYDIGRDLAYFANNEGGILIVEFNDFYRGEVKLIDLDRKIADIYNITHDIKPAIFYFSKSFFDIAPKKDVHTVLVPGIAQQRKFTYYPEES